MAFLNISTTESSSEESTNLIDRAPWPDEIPQDNEQLAPHPVQNTSLMRSKDKKKDTFGVSWYGFYRERLGNFLTLLFILLILIATIFYVWDGRPVFSIGGASSSTRFVLQPKGNQEIVPPISTFMILGQYNSEVYSYNNGVDKIYAYNPDPGNPQEREVVTVPKFEKFLWHNQGKLLLISRIENMLGNVYVLDLTLQKPAFELPTRREDVPNFPPNLQVDNESQVAWSQDSELIAFTAHNIESRRESLFIYRLGTMQLTYTPARDMDKISSLLWITNTLTTTADTLSFVAISDGQEKRYSIDSTGGGYSPWKLK